MKINRWILIALLGLSLLLARDPFLTDPIMRARE